MLRRRAGSAILHSVLATVAIATQSGTALAQTSPAAAPMGAAVDAGSAAAPPAAAPSAPDAPPPPPPAVVAPPPPPMAMAPAPPVAPMMMPPPPPPPAPPAPNPFKINYSFGVRAGLRLQDPDKPKEMTEVHLDNAYDSTVEARFNGKVTEQFSWVANFNGELVVGTDLEAAEGAVGVMDLIAQYQPIKQFNIWAGRLLVPSDRSNFTGPFFMSPWNYPGFYVAGRPPLGPKDNANGRDQGVTLWGNAFEDKFKYYGGVYGIDVSGPGTQPYVSGRISYSLQGSEPGYFGSSTYYGAKSVATIGLGAQYQKSGSIDTTTATPKDTALFMADALVEEATDSGTFTVEGQFYNFNKGYSFAQGYVTGASSTLIGTDGVIARAPHDSFYLLLSYLTPDLGIGKLQPLVRLQQAIDPGWTVFDGALALVIKSYMARVVATYQHVDRGSSGGPEPVANSLQLGIQLQNL